jgi:uncharacterized protein YdhG (YjbR/CyaY superfamily)
MRVEIEKYNALLPEPEKLICEKLTQIISSQLKDDGSKIWHAHPVWFLSGNPIVGFSKQKKHDTFINCWVNWLPTYP